MDKLLRIADPGGLLTSQVCHGLCTLIALQCSMVDDQRQRTLNSRVTDVHHVLAVIMFAMQRPCFYPGFVCCMVQVHSLCNALLL